MGEHWQQSHETVSTMQLTTIYDKTLGASAVPTQCVYLVIDTEGHEPQVIEGMHLEEVRTCRSGTPAPS